MQGLPRSLLARGPDPAAAERAAAPRIGAADAPGASRARGVQVGCGPCAASGLWNTDRRAQPGVDLVCDLLQLPFASASLPCAVAIHVLQDLPYPDVDRALRELWRVLRPGGWLRLGLPDLDRAIDAYRSGDTAYFYVPDRDAATAGGKLVAQIVWYGSVRTPFTWDCIAELLARAGFVAIARRRFGESAAGALGLARLDNRERESLFVEARRP
jgi:SAM-dependent methyltransferase